MKQQSLQLTESQLESDLQKVKAYLDRKQEHGNRQASLDVMSFDFSCHFEQPITVGLIDAHATQLQYQSRNDDGGDALLSWTFVK